MKSKLTKLLIAILITTICLISCAFLNKAEGAGESSDNQFEDPNQYDSHFFGNLAEAAAKQDPSFFQFDPAKVLQTAIDKGGIEVHSDSRYEWNNEGVACVSEEDHWGNTHQKITTILDINGDGTVTVTSEENGKVTAKKTRIYENEEAVKLAYEVAYYAKQSIESQEDGFWDDENGGNSKWKTLLRNWGFSRQSELAQQLGLPSSLFPHDYDNSIGITLEDERNEAREYAQKVLDGQDGSFLTGRFVFLEGYAIDENGNQIMMGQNNVIYSGSDEPMVEVPSFTIMKLDAMDGTPVEGAKFKIYKIENGKRQLPELYQRATSPNGLVHGKSNRVKIGDVLEIVEVSTPEGYKKSGQTSMRKQVVQGENIWTFYNIKEEDEVGLKIVKKDKINEEPVPGAEFHIYRMQEVRTNEGIYKVSNGQYVKLSSNEFPNTTKPASTNFDGTNFTLDHSSGGKDYWYATSSTAEAFGNRSMWKNSRGDDYEFTDADAPVDGDPYVEVDWAAGYIATHHTYSERREREVEVEHERTVEVPKVDEDGNEVLDEDGNVIYEEKTEKYWTTETEVYWVDIPCYGWCHQDETEIRWLGLVKVPSVNRGSNYWKKHYVKEFYSQGGGFTATENCDSESFKCVTDQNGEIAISNTDTTGISVGRKYFAHEVKAPDDYYLYLDGADFGIGTITETSKNVECIVKEERWTGNFILNKKDYDDSNHRLDRVGFRFYHEKYGWLVSAGTEPECFTEDEGGATVYYTDSGGNISISGVPTGGWAYIEDAESLNNAHYGFIPKLEGEGSFSVEKDQTTSFEVQNRRYLIRLSGVVWNDGEEGKSFLRDNLYGTGSDEPCAGWKVDFVAIGPNGLPDSQYCQSTTTGSDGTFVFKDIPIPLLNGEDDSEWSGNNFTGYSADIQFSYNGFIYQCVDVGASSNSSKASEGSDRVRLNNKFETVTGLNNKDTVAASGPGGSATVTYTLQSGRAEVLSTSGTDIMASTNKAGTRIYYNRSYMNTLSYADREELKDNNLGVYKRAHMDIAVTQGLECVSVRVKGLDHLYKHGIKGVAEGQEIPDSYFSEGVGIQFDDYKQPIYRADARFEAPSGEMNVLLTYKVALRNQSGSITTAVNSLVDYYDSKYTPNAVGMRVDEKGNIAEPLTFSARNNSGQGTYNSIDINTSKLTINPLATQYIYIQFKIDRTTALGMLDNTSQRLENVVEITSYSPTKDGMPYATTDKDACLDNVVIGNYDRYEDDTREAPGVQLVEAIERSVSGNIFEDQALPTLLAQGIRQGDGYYDETKEDIIKNLEVQLIEITGTGSSQSEQIYKNADNEEYRTKALDGKYTFAGFTPGKYVVRFVWGDLTSDGMVTTIDNTEQTQITPIDYKATIIDKDHYEEAIANPYYYRNRTEQEKKMSYGIDDIEMRKIIDTELNSHEGTANNGYNYNTRVEHRTMNSTTPIMEFNVEKDKETSNEAERGEDGLGLKYPVEGINFGIIRRPIQKIDIEKRISNIKVIYSSGEVIINADIDRNGNLSGETNYITYMNAPHADPKYGVVKIEMDNEVLENTTVKITYDYIFKNQSEKDYQTEEFYRNGIEGTDDEIVSISPSKIMDYVGKDGVLDASDLVNAQWLVQTPDILEGVVQEEVIESPDIKETTVYESRLLENAKVKPGSEAKTQMVITRDLETYRDFNLNNQTEIVELKKSKVPGETSEVVSSGSTIVDITPGNYIPSGLTAVSQLDDAMAEQVIIIQSQGENKNIVPYTIIAIIALCCVAGGIYYIKEELINKEK